MVVLFPFTSYLFILEGGWGGGDAALSFFMVKGSVRLGCCSSLVVVTISQILDCVYMEIELALLFCTIICVDISGPKGRVRAPFIKRRPC